MDYMTRRAHRMQKHKFSVTCLGALFMKAAPGSHQHEKSVSTFRALDAPKCTVTGRSHRMQKHNFGVTCPGILFMESALGAPEHEK
jgi:hypothetical protein